MARPREFEPDTALSNITEVFWRQGFEGTSMHDIEAATGLKKQSLYRAFGDKRGMYLAALRHYEETEVYGALDLLAAPGSARAKVERLFKGLLDAVEKNDRRGCFLCNASTDQAQLDPQTKAWVTETLGRLERGFRSALAVSAPYDKNVSVRNKTAARVLATYLGLRVLVKAGTPLASLKSTARQTLAGI